MPNVEEVARLRVSITGATEAQIQRLEEQISGGSYILGHGGGAHAQHIYCTPITWAEAQPGDLVFYPGDTHVGIVGGWDESGNIQIIHCSGSHNNVVITGKAGFATIGRPMYYSS